MKLKTLVIVGFFLLSGCSHNPVDSTSLSLSEWAYSKNEFKVEWVFAPVFVDEITKQKLIRQEGFADILTDRGGRGVLYLKDSLLTVMQQRMTIAQEKMVFDFEDVSERYDSKFVGIDRLEKRSLSKKNLNQRLIAEIAMRAILNKQTIENSKDSHVIRVVVKVVISKEFDRVGLIVMLTQLESDESRRDTKRVTVAISQLIKTSAEVGVVIRQSGQEFADFFQSLLLGDLPLIPSDKLTAQQNVIVLSPLGIPDSGYRLITKMADRVLLRKQSIEKIFDKEQRSFIYFKAMNYSIIDAVELEKMPVKVANEVAARRARQQRLDHDSRMRQLHHEANQRRVNKILQY